MKFRFAAIALAAAFSVSAQAQTEIQWWHSMTAVNGEVVNDLAKNFNASQNAYKIVPTFKGTYDESFTAAVAAFRLVFSLAMFALPAGTKARTW